MKLVRKKRTDEVVPVIFSLRCIEAEKVTQRLGSAWRTFQVKSTAKKILSWSFRILNEQIRMFCFLEVDEPKQRFLKMRYKTPFPSATRHGNELRGVELLPYEVENFPGDRFSSCF